MQEKTKSNSCFRIHTSLTHKYSIQFYFYFVKPITQIIYNDTKSITNIYAKDSFAIADNTEYLNRMYHYYNSFGKEEIYDRIRLIGGFYSNKRTMSESSTMIVTNTIKIFKTRQRRLRKMVASDGSSDQSEPDNDNLESFSTEGFLNTISDVSSQSSIESMFKSVENKISYDQETHNIYEQRISAIQISSLKNIYNDQDEAVHHLVCDFNDVDVEKTMMDYKRITENANTKKKEMKHLSLGSISAKKPVYQSIIINENKNHERKPSNVSNISPKLSRLLSERNLQHKMNKNEQHMQMNLDLNFEDRVSDEKRRLTSREKLSMLRRNKKQIRAEEVQDRDWRRQKIRNKANELLLRVKSQNYMHGYGHVRDYLNF